MNDFSELENQLKKLRPLPPSEDLAARIERALAEPASTAITVGVLPRARRFRINWFSLGISLAAAAVLLLFARFGTDHSVKKTPTIASRTPSSIVPLAGNASEFVPVGLTQVVYHTRDEGLHYPSGSEQPVRRLRSHTRETCQWRNPTTGATLRVSYPSEEVSLVPISGQ
jgi:hypothetical protein